MADGRTGIILFVAIIIALNIFAFYSAPSEQFDFSADTTEIWRVVTFQFFHFDGMHLLQNVLGLALTAALAMEIGLNFREFTTVYFVGIFIAIPIAFLFPQAAIAGNSTGIYAVLAASLIKARKLIPQYITLPLFGIFIFSNSLASLLSCGQDCLNGIFKTDFFHFFGFATGAGAEYVEQKVI